jgi:hypothetical protein
MAYHEYIQGYSSFRQKSWVSKMANLGWTFRLSEAAIRVLNVCECIPKVCDVSLTFATRLGTAPGLGSGFLRAARAV